MSTRIANLDEHVREALRQQIIAGGLEGGAHLSELQISKQFNVSRTPVREALCALAADGLIEMIPHRGAFVRETSETTDQDQQQVYAHMVGASAAMATERATIEMIMEIEQAAASLQSTQNFGAGVAALVSTIQKAAQNPTLDELIHLIERRMNMEAFYEKSASKKEAVNQTVTILMGAFKRKKADVAEKTMRQLIGQLSA